MDTLPVDNSAGQPFLLVPCPPFFFLLLFLGQPLLGKETACLETSPVMCQSGVSSAGQDPKAPLPKTVGIGGYIFVVAPILQVQVWM